MRATLIGGPGSWLAGTVPQVDVPEELQDAVFQYQGIPCISAGDVQHAGWNWECASFGGVPTSEVVLVREENPGTIFAPCPVCHRRSVKTTRTGTVCSNCGHNKSK